MKRSEICCPRCATVRTLWSIRPACPPPGLRERLLALFSGTDNGGAFEVIVQSFGFKYGIPPESDLVFDVRFLPNPYYEMSLREKNGTDPGCARVRISGRHGGRAEGHLTTMIDFLLPRYMAEGKSQTSSSASAARRQTPFGCDRRGAQRASARARLRRGHDAPRLSTITGERGIHICPFQPR